MFDVIFSPPDADVYHPSNVYPVLVEVGKSPYLELYVTVLLVVETFPPLALNVTVYVLAVHFAYKTVSDVYVLLVNSDLK